MKAFQAAGVDRKPETIASRLLSVRTQRRLTRNQARHRIGYTFDRYADTETGARLPQPIELPAIAYDLCDGNLEAFTSALEWLRERLAIEKAERKAAKIATSNAAHHAHAADPTAEPAA